MVGEHHQLSGYEFEQTLGDSEGQGSPACCSPRGHKELDVTEGLNDNSDLIPREKSLLMGVVCQIGVSTISIT